MVYSPNTRNHPPNLPMPLLTIAAIYLLIGCLFGVAFLVRGHASIAPESAAAGIAVRLLWTPAAVALWPVLTAKWIATARQHRAKP